MRKFILMLIFCMILSGCTNHPTETEKPTQPTTAPEVTVETAEPNAPALDETEATELIRMTVYYPDENAIGFLTKEMEGETLTFLEAMIDVGVLNEDVKVNSMAREDTHLTIDFNQAFRDLVCTMGTIGERMIIGSVVNTLIANYEVETVSITVEGETWESGHVIYDFPMSFFE